MAGQVQRPKPSIYTTARIAEVLYNAGLDSGLLGEHLVNVCCLDFLQKHPDKGTCTVYEYFLRYDETPFSFKFCANTVDAWNYAIDMLKTMVKHNKIYLGGIKVKIYISTDAGKKFYMLTFSDRKERNISRLNKLKKLAIPPPEACTHISVYDDRILVFVGLP